MRPAASDEGARGLCDSCTWHQAVDSSRGAVYILCRLSAVDDAFPRYPALPVFACRGYEAVDSEAPRSTTS